MSVHLCSSSDSLSSPSIFISNPLPGHEIPRSLHWEASKVFMSFCGQQRVEEVRKMVLQQNSVFLLFWGNSFLGNGFANFYVILIDI